MSSMNIRRLTQSAIMLALAVVLSFITVFKMPYGGSVTAASMVPILLISFKYDFKWGTFTAVVYAGLQMILGFYPPPVQSIGYFVLVILLDYVFAFGVLGLAALFAKPFKNKLIGVGFATICTLLLRLFCHFISGIVIWGVYAPEGQPVWLYSLTYNGYYMLGEIVISAVAVVLLQYKLMLLPEAVTQEKE